MTTGRWLAALSLAAAVAAPALAAQAPLRGIVVDETLTGPPVLADALPGGGPPAAPVIARIALDDGDFRGANAAAAFARLDGRIGQYRARQIAVVLWIARVPSTDADAATWQQTIRTIVDHERGQIAAYQIGDASIAASMPTADRFALSLKQAAVQIGSLDRDALMLEGPIAASAVEFQRHVYAAGAAAYVDGVAVTPAGPPDGEPSVWSSLGAMGVLIDQQDPTAFVILGPPSSAAGAPATLAHLLAGHVQSLGTRVTAVTYPGAGAQLSAALAAAAHFGDLLPLDLLTLDDASSGARLVIAGADSSIAVPHRLLFSASTVDTSLIYWGEPAGASIRLEITAGQMQAPTVRDPVTGQARAATVVQAGTANRPTVLTLPAATYPLILDFNFGESAHGSTAEAHAAALPPVEEIIRRYQQTQAAQDAALDHYTAHLRMEQHFRPSPAHSAYNVVTENTFYADRTGNEWDESKFSINGATWTSNRPAYPLIQPEKVLALPLALRLDEHYDYRLDGVDVVDGRGVFVVKFTPRASAQSLYGGTVWIDRETSVALKLHTVQTGMTGMVVSNDETQHFEKAGVAGGHDVWLLTFLTRTQVFLVAGTNMLVEQEMHFTDFEVNGAAFADRRAAARASDHVMYRDTDQGLRYFVKRGAERVVSDTLTTSVRALAMGADIDPSMDRPLPIAGIDLLNFNFLHRDMQLALLFGGVIAFGNIQHPNLWGGKFDASVDFFGLALKSTDAVFDGTGERRGERVDSIPASVGVRVGYQFTPFQKVSGRYEFGYTARFRAAGDTAATFVMPSSTATFGEGLSYEFKRGGYSFTATGTASQRSTWAAWGPEGGTGFDPATRMYLRYDAGVSKDIIFKTFHTIHLNAAYFGGERLDRFSMYQFGLFDQTRLHGVPSAVRFAELAMVRASYSFNLFDQYRFDLFLDRANGRGALTTDPWESVTGLGVGLNFRGPHNTLVRLDYGHSLLPPRYRSAGSNTFQIMILKPL